MVILTAVALSIAVGVAPPELVPADGAAIEASETAAVPVVALAVESELRPGDTGPDVASLNAQLRESGFTAPEGDVFDEQTLHAVYALEKVRGVEPTGVFTPEMWAWLDETPSLGWRPERDRVEIDLDRQVLFVVEDGTVEKVVTVSSGSGSLYRGSNGRLVPAKTPEGEFSFERTITGLRRSYLGVLYNPFYFRGGYAVHGSPSVPNYPASHGCVRVTNWDMDILKNEFALGMPVFIYGLTTERPAPPPIELPRPVPA